MSACSGDCPIRRTHGSDAAAPSRRTFVSQAVLASVGVFLTASCGDGNIGGVTGPGGSGPKPIPGGAMVISIADFPGLASDDGIARVDGGSATPVAVTRINAASYLAFSLICPHAGYRPVGIVNGFGFVCPNHGAEFAPDGDWTGGQRTRDLKQYVVVFDGGAGTLTIS